MGKMYLPMTLAWDTRDISVPLLGHGWSVVFHGKCDYSSTPYLLDL